MKSWRTMTVTAACSIAVSGCAISHRESGMDTLTTKEKQEGWILLFDGRTTNGWHTFNATGVSSRWHVQNGELLLEPSPTRRVSGADIETEERFGDFELTLEWKMTSGGNSGIFYRVDGTGYVHPWEIAPEYQLVDNAGVDNDAPTHQAGALWDFYAPVRDVTKPLGEFNRTRILVEHNHVEHWMNGTMLLSYELGSQDFEARHAKSVYGSNPFFGTIERGTIALQDEGRLVSFRNIKIRRLD
jgi:hypothetical protein